MTNAKWTYENISKVLDSRDYSNVKACSMKLAQDATIGKTAGAIQVVLYGFRKVANGQRVGNYISPGIKKMFHKYISEHNGNGIKSHSSTKTISVDGKEMTLDQMIAELDNGITDIKQTISNIIERAVTLKVQLEREENKALRQQVEELKQFQEEAKKSNIWTNLTKKLNNIA